MLKAMGEKIMRLRYERGLSLEKVAEMAQIAPATLSRLENNKSAHPRVAHSLCTALNVSMEEVFIILPNKKVL